MDNKTKKYDWKEITRRIVSGEITPQACFAEVGVDSSYGYQMVNKEKIKLGLNCETKLLVPSNNCFNLSSSQLELDFEINQINYHLSNISIQNVIDLIRGIKNV